MKIARAARIATAAQLWQLFPRTAPIVAILIVASVAAADDCLFVSSPADGGRLEVLTLQGDLAAEPIALESPQPSDVAVAEKKAYVVSSFDRQVLVVDLEAARVVASISVGSEAYHLLAIPGLHRVYLIERLDFGIMGAGSPPGSEYAVSVIDTRSDEIVRSIDQVGLYPQSLALGSDGQRLFVSALSPTLAEVDLPGERVADLLRAPAGYSVSLLGETAFIGTTDRTLAFFDVSRRLVTDQLALQQDAREVAVVDGRVVVLGFNSIDDTPTIRLVDPSTKAISHEHVLEAERTDWGRLQVYGGTKVFALLAFSSLYAIDVAREDVVRLAVTQPAGLAVGACPPRAATTTPSSSPTITPSFSRTETPAFATATPASATVTPGLTESATRSPNLTPAASPDGGCAMGDRHAGLFPLVLAAIGMMIRPRRRRSPRLPLAASTLFWLVEPAQASWGGSIIIRFRDSLTQCAHCVLESGGVFADVVSDGSSGIDVANESIGVTSADELFVQRHGIDTAAANAQERADISDILARFPERTRRIPIGAPEPPLLTNVYRFHYSADVSPETACALYLRDENVEYCQPELDGFYTVSDFTPDDPYFFTRGTWGNSYDDLWGLRATRTDRAWKTSVGDGIVVAVVDTGIDPGHEDLATNVDASRGRDFIDGDDFPDDQHGHGSHVAGTIAAVGQNGVGIVGVAPRARIFGVRGLNQNASARGQSLTEALRYATRSGAQVINNSWGCAGRACFTDRMVEDLISYATGMGTVVVFAAGNDNDDVYYHSIVNFTEPMLKPIVVAADYERRRRAGFSNFGVAVDASAPGTDILSLRSGLCLLPNPYTGCFDDLTVSVRYQRKWGTSMAAPHVSGVAALLLECNRLFKNEDIRQILKLSGRDRWPRGPFPVGGGEVNSDYALRYTQAPILRLTYPKRFSIFRDAGVVDIIGTVDADRVVYYKVYFGRGTNPQNWTSLATGRGPVRDDVLARWDVGGLPSDVYTIKVRARVKLPYQLGPGCGEVRAPSGYRSVSLEEVQYVWVSNGVTEVFAGPATEPDVSGDLIAWLSGAAPSQASRVQYLSMLDRAVRTLGAPNAFAQRPAVSDGRIAWIDSRTMNTPQVYLFDVANGQEHRVSNATIGARESVSLGGGLAAWKDSRDGDNTVYGYDVASDTEFRVPGAVNASEPRTDGRRIVWSESSGVGLHIYDHGSRATTVYNSELKRIDRFGHERYVEEQCPDIDGAWIVWLEHRNDDTTPVPGLDIYAYNTDTGEERRLTPFTAPGLFQDGRSCPRIHQGRIVWSQYVEQGAVFEYDVSADQLRRLTFADRGFEISANPSVGAGWIVWDRTRSLDTTVRIFAHPNDF